MLRRQLKQYFSNGQQRFAVSVWTKNMGLLNQFGLTDNKFPPLSPELDCLEVAGTDVNPPHILGGSLLQGKRVQQAFLLRKTCLKTA